MIDAAGSHVMARRVFNLQSLWGRKTISSVASQRRAGWAVRAWDSNSSHSCLWKIYFLQHFWRFTLRGLIYISCTIRLLSKYQHLIKHANQLSYARLHFPSVNLSQGYCSCIDVRCHRVCAQTHEPPPVLKSSKRDMWIQRQSVFTTTIELFIKVTQAD